MAEVGGRIRELRERKQFTQQEFAKRCGVSRNTIVRTESGETTPSFALIVKAAHGLGVDPGELFRPKVTALPRTPLTDTAPEKLDERLSGLGGAKEAGELLDKIREEELDLEQFLITALNPKLLRARLYRAAILDRWTKLTDEQRAPDSNRFKTVSEIAEEIGAAQEWLRGLRQDQEEQKGRVSNTSG